MRSSGVGVGVGGRVPELRSHTHFHLAVNPQTRTGTGGPCWGKEGERKDRGVGG